ncbi:MAG: DUF262 domain-containing HNH endonuclease family protein [Rugosibacter sp.]|nr:DUF262 domain-containing HNH endonuclease family protein [Rugosibacter sp.]
MEKPISLVQLFTKKLFRIPDYQRGYAWQREQLKSFWEDLVNLKENRSHYTGVLTLTEVKSVATDSKEFWLVDGHSYNLFNVVDGQQRLTTFIILIQVFADFFRALPENQGLSAKEIYVTVSLTLADIESCYLFRMNPRGGYRTYLFGYTDDNPSQDYLRYNIMGESGCGDVQETFYTLNLGYAKKYFSQQIAELHKLQGTNGLTELFKKLTKSLMFNEYSIDDEFDVFVAFETMNNRGKRLSDLELLKNRLIFLTTLYDESKLDEAGRKNLRDEINGAWKEVYFQLGRNKTKPLNDDDFLRAHWISYFKYSRDTGRDYAHFLLDEYFSPKNVHDMVEKDVPLEIIEEQRSEIEPPDGEESEVFASESLLVIQEGRLSPESIKDFVTSLRESAGYWFSSFYPHLVANMSNAEISAIDQLNRIGMGYFRPLVMTILKADVDEIKRIQIFKKIERFIFIAFRMGASRSNYQSSAFYNLVRKLDRKEVSFDDISNLIESALAYAFNKDDNTLRIDDFYNLLYKKFDAGKGYYTWSGLRYFLYEYELHLLSGSRQQKVEWGGLLKSERDSISVEHIYPQTPTPGWDLAFNIVSANERARYSGSIGNLLLLSKSINSSLQNDEFTYKKQPKFDSSNKKIRNGYSDGSHSEIEVASNKEWGPEQIKERGEKLLKFMETRWGFSLRDEDRTKLLFLEPA